MKLKQTYDELSPITKNKCVLTEMISGNIVFRQCQQTGYYNYSNYVEENDNRDEINQTVTKLLTDNEEVKADYLKLVFKDSGGKIKTNRLWYPPVHVNPFYVLYPAGNSYEDFEWILATVDPITEESDINNTTNFNVFFAPENLEPSVVHVSPYKVAVVAKTYKSTEYESAIQDYNEYLLAVQSRLINAKEINNVHGK